MRRTTLTAWEAVQILFPPDTPPDSAATAQFRSGADVCEILAAHFGFDADDYAELLAHDFDPLVHPQSEGGRMEGSDPPAAAEPAAAEPAATRSPEEEAAREAVLVACEAVGDALFLTMSRAFSGGTQDGEVRAAWRSVGEKILAVDD